MEEEIPKSYISRLRKLTRKSQLRTTMQYERLVSSMLITKPNRDKLIWCYYHLSNITFMDDILDELGIPKQYRIDKPGKDEAIFQKLGIDYVRVGMSSNGSGTFNNPRTMEQKTRTESKSKLKRRNHGHKLT